VYSLNYKTKTSCAEQGRSKKQSELPGNVLIGIVFFAIESESKGLDEITSYSSPPTEHETPTDTIYVGVSYDAGIARKDPVRSVFLLELIRYDL
jgi:hypothetical protein